MMWTRRVPAVPGFYWLREPGKPAVVVEVILSGIAPKLFVSFTQSVELVELSASVADGAEWFGPLLAPT